MLDLSRMAPSQTRTQNIRGKSIQTKKKVRESIFSRTFPTRYRSITCVVAPPRLELGTQGSSGLCSTN